MSAIFTPCRKNQQQAPLKTFQSLYMIRFLFTIYQSVVQGDGCLPTEKNGAKGGLSTIIQNFYGIMRCFDRKMYFMIEMFHKEHDAKRVAFRNVFVEYRREYVTLCDEHIMNCNLK